MLTQLLLFGAFVAVMILLSVNYNRRTRICFIVDSSFQCETHEMDFFTMLKWKLREEHLFDKLELYQPTTQYKNIFDVIYSFDEDIAKNKPKYIVFMLGIQDILQENKIEEFSLQFENICNKLTHLQTKICICNIPAVSDNESTQELIDNYNNYFNQFKTKSEFITINLKKNILINISDKMPHISSAESSIISETIWNTIRKIS
jgi:hypothetical protein